MGVAFLLVTFLWPRKEKSLAKPRSGGETPSRTESSRPAWRSHAHQASDPLTLALSRRGRGNGDRGRLRFANRPYWRSHANTLLQGKDVTDPLTLALSRKGRGDGYRGRLRFANRPYAKVATAPDSRYQIAPLTIDLGKGSTDARRHITEPEWSYLWF